MANRERDGHWLAKTIAVVVTAPLWVFLLRWWWEAIFALLTKPWREILCIGTGCGQ